MSDKKERNTEKEEIKKDPDTDKGAPQDPAESYEPTKEVSESKQEHLSPEDIAKMLEDRNAELIKALNETTKALKEQKKVFDSKINDLEDKLNNHIPQRYSDNKANISGYYQFKADKSGYVGNEAADDLTRAARDLEILKSIYN